LASNGGEVPHEAEYPYLYKEPNRTCPLDAKIFNTGAKVTHSSKDYKCNEDKMKQLVTISIHLQHFLFTYILKIKLFSTKIFTSNS
jgi:hypothetical protein